MPKKIKIVIFSNTTWGITNFRLQLAQQLRVWNYEVIFISGKDRSECKLREENFQFHAVNLDRHSTNLLTEARTFFQIFLIFRRIKPDVVLSFTIKPNFYSSILRLFLKYKLICNVTGLGALFDDSFLTRYLLQQLIRHTIMLSNHVFFQNESDKQTYIGKRSLKNYSVTYGSGIDLDKFTPVDRKTNEYVTFTFVARMLWSKGIAEFCKASAIIASQGYKCKFDIWGIIEDNSSKDALKLADLKRLETQYPVTYRGVTDSPQDVIPMADCIVLPSFYNEGSPKVLIEAAACGVPVIASDVAGCQHIVKDGKTGFICKAKDHEDLAAKVVEFLNLSSKQKANMSDEARTTAEKIFDQKNLFKTYAAVIEKTLANSKFRN